MQFFVVLNFDFSLLWQLLDPLFPEVFHTFVHLRILELNL